MFVFRNVENVEKIVEMQIFSYLEETVVRSHGDVVCLGDVVHQSPEVLDCVKSSHLKIIEMIMMILKITEIIMMIRAQRSQAYYMYKYKTGSSVQIFHYHKIRFSIEYLCDYEARPGVGFPPSCETRSYKTRESTCCSAGASSSYISTLSVTNRVILRVRGSTPSC